MRVVCLEIYHGIIRIETANAPFTQSRGVGVYVNFCRMELVFELVYYKFLDSKLELFRFEVAVIDSKSQLS